MNIFEFAKKMEKDGEAYYNQLAENSTSKGLKTILNMLSDAERKHYDVLVEMEKGVLTGLPETGILDNAKNVFAGMEKSLFMSDTALPQIEVYKKALDIEKASREFYEQKAGDAGDAGDAVQKGIFLKIAEEEKQHFFLMEEMLEFMQRPFRWLENAEWHHFDEY
jgi:rubrerythrin